MDLVFVTGGSKMDEHSNTAERKSAEAETENETKLVSKYFYLSQRKNETKSSLGLK